MSEIIVAYKVTTILSPQDIQATRRLEIENYEHDTNDDLFQCIIIVLEGKGSISNLLILLCKSRNLIPLSVILYALQFPS